MSRARSRAERSSRPLTLTILEATSQFDNREIASELELALLKNAATILKNSANMLSALRFFLTALFLPIVAGLVA